MQTASISPKTLARHVLQFPQPLPDTTAAVPELPVLRPVIRIAPAALSAADTRLDARLHDARNALASLYLLTGLLREPGVLSAAHAQYAEDLDLVTRMLGGLLGAGADSASCVASAAARAATADTAVKGCAQMLQAVAGARVAVFVSAENHLPPLRLDDDALARVLLNLVKNAAEAMPDGGVVRITARRALGRTDKAVLVHVSDDGPGIPAYALGRIFEPGFSSKPQRTGASAAESCGLGLAIVRELVEASGGAVKVASTRRRGTTFELRLPCCADTADGPADEAAEGAALP